MGALTHNKFLVLGFILVALLGAAALVGTLPATEPEARTPEGEGRSAIAADEPVADVIPAPVEGATVQEEEELSNGVSSVPIVRLAGGPSLAILKDVGEAAYPRFGLTREDFQKIKSAGFDVIEGNFDICADDTDVKFFLDSAESVGLKAILTAGAGEAEWGYPCDGDFDPGMVPTWQREKVKAWVETWKNHPALYAWDTSNEDGGTFPFGTGGIQPDPEWETKYALTLSQLQEAYRDVKSFDPAHPVMIRMNGWYFYDYPNNFFRAGNAFGRDVADIVMVNAYSNVDEYISDFVATVLLRATRAMYAIDPRVTIVPALGVWREPPIWVKPTVAQLVNDFNQAQKAENLLGIAFFKYGTRGGNDWFLPDPVRGDPKLWQTIRELIQ